MVTKNKNFKPNKLLSCKSGNFRQDFPLCDRMVSFIAVVTSLVFYLLAPGLSLCGRNMVYALQSQGVGLGLKFRPPESSCSDTLRPSTPSRDLSIGMLTPSYWTPMLKLIIVRPESTPILVPKPWFTINKFPFVLGLIHITLLWFVNLYHNLTWTFLFIESSNCRHSWFFKVRI